MVFLNRGIAVELLNIIIRTIIMIIKSTDDCMIQYIKAFEKNYFVE